MTNKMIALSLDPSNILKARGMEVDKWQREFLLSKDPYVLLNCCRQAGKSTVVSALALHQALFNENQTVLILSPGQRQSGELFRKVMENYNALGRFIKASYETQLKMELANGSRIICLPGKEQTIRGYSPNLLIVDEASRVPDDLYRSIRPMLAVTKGRMVALSTPFGQRGWFWKAWTQEDHWKKVRITWKECPRISPDFIHEELKTMSVHWVNQEYECLFTALEGLVYPEFENCLVDMWTPKEAGKQVGGIDWGWRNPFAAVWGVLDHQDILWIQEERYMRETPLHIHAKALPKIMWYCDPAGRTEAEEFRVANHTVRRGFNDLTLGIQAVNARIKTGRLKILRYGCPNLIDESRLYRYPTEAERPIMGEKPVDENNHALGALRYLISRIDQRFIAKLRKKADPRDAEVKPLPLEESIGALHQATVHNRLWNNPNVWSSYMGN